VNEPIGTANADHYIWGQICDGWHLVRSENLSVIEERMPPATEEQRHWHQHARQFFYVVEGELTMQFDDGNTEVGPRQGIEITPGVPHQAKNRSASDARFLVISQPPSHGDRQT